MTDQTNTKRTQINIRLSPIELEKVQLSADTLNISVGRYCKYLVTESPLVRPNFNAETQLKIIQQLHGMANNLNQLAKVANTNGEIDVTAVKQLGKEMTALWQRLER